jgi:hypothetical protein
MEETMCKHATITDTAFEYDEIPQPNGETVLELTKLEIEHCPTCDKVVEWRPEEI